jgi:hypothetical protein
MELEILKKQELIRELKEMPCFRGKNRRLKALNKQLGNLIKRQAYKEKG